MAKSFEAPYPNITRWMEIGKLDQALEASFLSWLDDV